MIVQRDDVERVAGQFHTGMELPTQVHPFQFLIVEGQHRPLDPGRQSLIEIIYGGSSTWKIGTTGKIRDAKIELCQGAVSAVDDNVGFVPLLHLDGEYRWNQNRTSNPFSSSISRLRRSRSEIRRATRSNRYYRGLPETTDHPRQWQKAIFDPVGLGGLMYWYLVYPLHQIVFGGILHGIAHAVEHPPGEI